MCDHETRTLSLCVLMNNRLSIFVSDSSSLLTHIRVTYGDNIVA